MPSSVVKPMLQLGDVANCKADLHVKLVRQNLHLKTQLLELEIAELT